MRNSGPCLSDTLVENGAGVVPATALSCLTWQEAQNLREAQMTGQADRLAGEVVKFLLDGLKCTVV